MRAAVAGYAPSAPAASHSASTFSSTELEKIDEERESVVVGSGVEVALYNGTNADDLTDPTRLGLLSAAHHRVNSPVCELSKARVRELARAAGLPNWNLAAAPCLRSRLAPGVTATPVTLGNVEAAEAAVSRALGLTPEENMRVRVMKKMSVAVDAAVASKVGGGGESGISGDVFLNGGDDGELATAVIEVDVGRLAKIEGDPGLSRELETALRAYDLVLDGIRAFKSGSVAKLPPSQ